MNSKDQKKSCDQRYFHFAWILKGRTTVQFPRVFCGQCLKFKVAGSIPCKVVNQSGEILVALATKDVKRLRLERTDPEPGRI